MRESRSGMGVGRIRRALVAIALLGGVLAVAGPASAAPPTTVDFTVREALPVGTPGTLTVSDVPGCATASVATVDASRVDAGPSTIFRGTKVFDCGGGDTFSLRFFASVRGCSSTDSGRWRITSGTGAFSSARGSGELVGTYYRLDGTSATACDNDGIDDRYTGRLRLS